MLKKTEETKNSFILENNEYIIDLVGNVAYKKKAFLKFLDLEKKEREKIIENQLFLKTSFFEEYNDTLEKIRDLIDEDDNFTRLKLIKIEELVTFDNFSEKNLVNLQKMKKKFNIPEHYLFLDIKEEIMKDLKEKKEKERADYEFKIFEKRDLLIIPKIAKFIVDVCRKKNLILGIGRGSSVASFVLYKIGLHRINPLLYDISFSEFLE